MANGLSYQEEPKHKSGFYISNCAAFIAVAVVVVLLVAEGLLIGLLVPSSSTCVKEPTSPTTTIKDTATSPPTTNKDAATSNSVISATTPANPDAIWYKSRLPNSLNPIDYEMKLRPVLEPDAETGLYIFYGSSSVRYTCDEATEYVMMHSSDLNYSMPLSEAFTITDETDSADVTIVDIQFYSLYEYVVLTTDAPCVVGHIYMMEAKKFQGELGDDLSGLYRSEYDNEAGEHRVIAASQMESTGARHTFPCFDEPPFKARFNIALYHRTDEGYFAVSNMPVVSYKTELIESVTWNLTTFEISPLMSTYLIALVVCDFPYEEAYTADSTIQTRIYARDVPVSNGEVLFAAQVSPTILDVYADHFNVPYPLPKSDQMAVSDFGAGAMENWGLVLYREVYLLYDPLVSSISDKLSVAQVIAHELAHQWFGNLVTCAWWSDIWLNEGFASYVQYIGAEGINSNWTMDELFIIDDLQAALYADDSSNSHPLYHPQGYFSTVTYSKGASFIRMVSEFLGEPTFTNALTNYLNERSYNVATHDVLFQYWIDEANKDGLSFPYDLQSVFETWVLQMGFPLLSIGRTDANTITVTQKYFLIDPNDEAVSTDGSDMYNYKWYVPFTYKSSSNIAKTNYTHEWMNLTDPLTLSLTDDYILANINAVGFYRVLYEDQMWEKIVIKMNSSTFEDISSQNRAQLLDDAFAISRSGQLPIESALSMTTYLHQELEYIPWVTFQSAIVYFDRMLARSSIYGDFSQYVLDMAVPSIYDYYGWDDSNDSDNLMFERRTRGLAIELACDFGYPACIDRASSMYHDWMTDPDNNTIGLKQNKTVRLYPHFATPVAEIKGDVINLLQTYFSISATYRTDVYCTAIRAGQVEEWDFAWDRYLAVDSAQEKTNLRYAMSCTKDPWLINRYIEYALDNTKVRNQDASRTLSYIGGQEYAKYVAWSFARNNWQLLMDTVGASATDSMLSAAVRRFSTQFDLDLIEDLRSIAGTGWSGTLNSYASSVRINMAWRSENEAKIAAWLGSDVPLSDIPTMKDTNKLKKSISQTDFFPHFQKGFDKKF